MSQPSTLTLDLPDLAALEQHYLPFINGGGLFVPLATGFYPGAPVKLNLRLPSSTNWREVLGQMVWHTPTNAQNNQDAGIGVQLDSSEQDLQQLLKKLLAGLPVSNPAGAIF